MDNASKARQRAVRARRHVGLSQKDVAVAMNTSVQVVSGYERGLSAGDKFDLNKFCKIVGITTHWLYTGTWEKGTKPPARRYTGDVSPQMSARLASMQTELDEIKGLLSRQNDLIERLITLRDPINAAKPVRQIHGVV